MVWDVNIATAVLRRRVNDNLASQTILEQFITNRLGRKKQNKQKADICVPSHVVKKYLVFNDELYVLIIFKVTLIR